MNKELNFLTDEDVLLLRELLTREKERRVNPPSRTPYIPNTDQTPEVYIVKTRVGGIPALVPHLTGQDVPGVALCDLYRILEGKLWLLTKDIEVYNLSTTAISANIPRPAVRDKFGKWVVVEVNGATGGAFTVREIDGAPSSTVELQTQNTSLDTSGSAVVLRNADATHSGLVSLLDQVLGNNTKSVESLLVGTADFVNFPPANYSTVIVDSVYIMPSSTIYAEITIDGVASAGGSSHIKCQNYSNSATDYSANLTLSAGGVGAFPFVGSMSIGHWRDDAAVPARSYTGLVVVGSPVTPQTGYAVIDGSGVWYYGLSGTVLYGATSVCGIITDLGAALGDLAALDTITVSLISDFPALGNLALLDAAADVGAASLTDPIDSPADADALRDDLVANLIPSIASWMNNLRANLQAAGIMS